MEPVTHVLTGACLARSGLNRRAAYTTLAMAIAAELPDMDTLWSVRGPIAGLEHHRGITHTLLGVPFEAAFVVLVIYGLHRWRLARARKRPTVKASAADHIRINRPLTAAPVRWGMLYVFCLLALLSHLLLDYTNNYGLRPFFPFNPHWYAASIVFIFDPWIFALLVLGLVAPAIFRLINAEVGARRQPFAARGWSAAALLLIVAFWGLRWIEHDRALQLAQSQSLEAPPTTGPGGMAAGSSASLSQQTPDEQTPDQQTPTPVYLTAQRALANPDPLSIFRWYTVTDFGPIYQLERADTRQQTLVATEGTYAKPDRSPASLAAEASPLGKVYFDWSPMPILTVDSSSSAVDQAVSDSDVPPPAGGVVVTLSDPRFMGVLPWLSEGRSTPLTATIVLDSQRHVVLQALDGRTQTAK